jgi:hypothetical protein
MPDEIEFWQGGPTACTTDCSIEASKAAGSFRDCRPNDWKTD